MRYLLLIFLLITILSANAEIMTDGTLGQQINLPGNNFQITPNLGQQHGSNLFHSFQDFNLNSSESATFSGPNSVQNIISRVTGGNSSSIDGLIRSTIPNADFYFLNPYGIMFGSNAKLDIQGSFHASTADYLRLGENGRFDVRNPSDSLLTVAPLESFGFLTDSPASITTKNSNLSVFEGKDLSLIGGDLNLTGEASIQFDEMGFEVLSSDSKISATNGQINLVSVGSKGEFIADKLELQAEGGKIIVTNSLFDISGSGGIFIRGKRLLMHDSSIWNHLAEQDGKNIEMNLQESIHITGNLLAISNITLGSGNVGNIDIITPHLEITGSIIDAGSKAAGNAGTINIKATDVLLQDGAMMTVGAKGNGAGGSLNIQASNSMSLSGYRKGTIVNTGRKMTDYPCFITGSTYGSYPAGNITITTSSFNTDGYITANTHGEGQAGDIIFNVDNLTLTDGGFITSSTDSKGHSGNINITATDTVSLTGRNQRVIFGVIPINTMRSNIGTTTSRNGDIGNAGNVTISAANFNIDDGDLSTTTGGDGNGGNISINSKNIQIKNGGLIQSNTAAFLGDMKFIGNGEGGHIKVITDEITVSDSNISSDTFNTSSGGDIIVEAKKITVNDSGTISAKSHDTGDAGQVTMQANTINLTNQGQINTEAENATGGNLAISVSDLLYLHEGKITTSVGAGKGQGGNISIENPNFIVLNQGQIKAQADTGHGGNINIKSEQFITSPDSLVSASSNLGLDGDVNIESLDVDLTGALKAFGINFLNAAAHMKRHCTIEQKITPSTFYVFHVTGSQPFPADFIANELILIEEEEIDLKTEIKESKTVNWIGCRPNLTLNKI
ncbi:filamentous hemagglutinin N-terminal domain-containing protein [Thiotrichales bacterium HSG1]|nr:filamentous hemagglutinin N-terminal domain-containing protein [Thiotrichales bacterium HSG1]